MWFDATDVNTSKKIFLNISKSPQGGQVLIFPLKREDKYVASLGVDNKLIFFHIWEAKVDYFVEREIKYLISLNLRLVILTNWRLN